MTSNATPEEGSDLEAEDEAFVDPTEDFADEVFEPPTTIIVAARMMWAGALLSLISVLLLVVEMNEVKDLIADRLRSNHEYSRDQVDVIYLNQVVYSLVLAVAGAAIWIWMAAKNRAGRRWARSVATTLGAINLLGFVSLLSVDTIVSSELIVTAASVTLGVAVLVLLWLPSSSDYYYLSNIPRARR